MRATRIFTGKDALTHFEDFEVPVASAGTIGRLSEPLMVDGLILRETDGTYDYDWHAAPRKQWIILLDGRIEITTGDGAVRQFDGGDILLVEDTSGRGHRTRQLSDGIRRSLFHSDRRLRHHTMNTPISGIHHVTAIASDPQANVDFYAGLLGLRLVKKTVNFDDPSAYHLYYGDETGSPGTIVTFFTWPDGTGRGRVGPGQTTRLSFSGAPSAMDFWRERLTTHGVRVNTTTRFGEDVLTFEDPDHIPVEIVAVADDSRSGWAGSDIPPTFALRGLHTAELTVRDAAPTEALITGAMGYRLVKRDGARARFETGTGGSGTFIDVIADPTTPAGLGGVGTIHHIAWRVPGDIEERAMQDRLGRAGFQVSPVRDRSYFRSIYYRERGGILFEIATDVPGFPDDEPVASLGTTLKLPRQFEHARTEIERLLPPLHPAREYA